MVRHFALQLKRARDTLKQVNKRLPAKNSRCHLLTTVPPCQILLTRSPLLKHASIMNISWTVVKTIIQKLLRITIARKLYPKLFVKRLTIKTLLTEIYYHHCPRQFGISRHRHILHDTSTDKVIFDPSLYSEQMLK